MNNTLLKFGFLLSLCFVLFTACTAKKGASTVSKTKVNFITSNSLSTILEKSDREKKPVFIDLYTDWCTPCKIMDADVFGDQVTADYMNKNFINLKVDAEKGNGPNIAALYGVYVYPTLLFVDSKGVVLERMDGTTSHSGLVAMGDRALANAGWQ